MKATSTIHTSAALKVSLLAVLLGLSAALAGCGNDNLFPDAPEGSFIRTGIGPGPVGPVGPTSGHTTLNPTGVR